MKKVALAIKTGHPNIAFNSAARSEVMEIAAARFADNGMDLETIDLYIKPKKVKFTESDKIDKGLDVEKAEAECIELDEVIKHLDQWLGGNPYGQKVYVFSKNEQIALQTLDSIHATGGIMARFLEKYRCTLVQDEMVRQFNVALNRHCTPTAVAKSFMLELPHKDKVLTAVQTAENSLMIARLMPLREMFESFRVGAPLLYRYDEWARLNNFCRDPSMDPKVTAEGRACRVIVHTKSIYAGKKKAIARVTAIKRIDGNVLPYEIFDRYIVPTKFSMDRVDSFDDGLTREDIEENGMLFETVFEELSEWIESNRSACLYTWDEQVLSDIQESDAVFGTNYYNRIFGSIQQELIPITNLYVGCFSDGIITPKRIVEMFALDTKDAEAAFEKHDPKAEVRVFMAILLNSMNRRNGAAKARERAEKELERQRQAIAEADAARDPMDVNIAYYTKPIKYRQGATRVDVGNAARYLSDKTTRTFRCPECNREMLLDYWYLDSDVRNEIPFGGSLTARGELSCKDHGFFLCTARVYRDSESGVLIGQSQLMQYNDETYMELQQAKQRWEEHSRAEKEKAKQRKAAGYYN